MLTPTDLRGLYAILPTPATPGADRADAVDTVDLDATTRVVDRLISDGASGILALGTTGECATLTRREYDAFVDHLLSTVRRRVPTFVGATALGTHEVIERLRFARDLGADGTLLGLPMWQPLTLEMAVAYYRSVSEALPDLAIMVYANTRAFRFDFSPAFWAAVADQAPTVMSAKFSRPDELLPALEAAKGRINFLPNEGAAYRFAELAPEAMTGCWATAASMGPEPVLALMNAILARDMERAKRVDVDIQWAAEPFKAITKQPEIFASYNIQLEKVRINAAGYCDAGPIRPPYDRVPEELASAARECAARWVRLRKKYEAPAHVAALV
jgi:dihydrodipicolinate synthase/N-acetylneuraminate lyase